MTTATGLSALVDGAHSHDQITRFLGQERYDQKRYWKTIKPVVRRVEADDGVLLVDDTIEEKSYTDENDIVCYHYDHSKSRTVKGINIVNFVYHTSLDQNETMSIPVVFELVAKKDVYLDKKTGKYKHKSEISKNEMVRERLKILVQRNRLKLKYILWDSWFSAKENMQLVKSAQAKCGVGEITNQDHSVSKQPYFAAMIAFIKLEQLKLRHRTNHFALKTKLYIKAIKAAFSE